MGSDGQRNSMVHDEVMQKAGSTDHEVSEIGT
jgi:hypothetical protein